MRLNPVWVAKALKCLVSNLARAHCQLRTRWRAVGMASYVIFTLVYPLHRLQHTYSWMSQVMRQHRLQDFKADIQASVWSSSVQIPGPVQQEWTHIHHLLTVNDWVPMWRPPPTPDLQDWHIFIIDASPWGFACLHRPPCDGSPGPKTYTAYSAAWTPNIPAWILAEQFHRESMAFHQVISTKAAGPLLSEKCYLVTDCQGITRSHHRRYSSSPLLQECYLMYKQYLSLTKVRFAAKHNLHTR